MKHFQVNIEDATRITEQKPSTATHFKMLKWFGLEPAKNEEGRTDVDAVANETKNDSSTDGNHSTSDSCGTGGDKLEKGDKPSSTDEQASKSTNASSMSGAFGLLSSFASAATKTAHKLKESVDEKLDKTILGDFQRENEKFVKEKYSRRAENPVPPWVGYNEEKEMKSQILALSSDERHFLRDPPAGVDFHFDLDATMPVALTILAEDENLQKMRFNLVPKKVKEERFWRNYFYRVSLIKQSSQLSTLAQAEMKRSSSGSDIRQSSQSDLDKLGNGNGKENVKQESVKSEDKSQPDNTQADNGSKETSTNKADSDDADWEKDLQDELQDFEFVSEDQGDGQEPHPEWEKEIESMLGLDDDENEPTHSK